MLVYRSVSCIKILSSKAPLLPRSCKPLQKANNFMVCLILCDLSSMPPYKFLLSCNKPLASLPFSLSFPPFLLPEAFSPVTNGFTLFLPGVTQLSLQLVSRRKSPKADFSRRLYRCGPIPPASTAPTECTRPEQTVLVQFRIRPRYRSNCKFGRTCLNPRTQLCVMVPADLLFPGWTDIRGHRYCDWILNESRRFDIYKQSGQ